jgi:hypothetical protein
MQAASPLSPNKILDGKEGGMKYLDHISWVRLLLWTAATNGRIIHPQVMYEHGGQWWNDYVGRGKFLIRPPELAVSSISRVVWWQVGGTVESNENWVGHAKYFCSYMHVIFFTCHAILRHGASGFTSLPKEGVLRISVALKNPLPRLGLNPQTFCPVESTLTITPSRRHEIPCYFAANEFNVSGVSVHLFVCSLFYDVF